MSRAAAIGFCAFFFFGGVREGYAQLWRTRHELTSAEIQKEFDRLGRSGFRLVDISGYSWGPTVRFAGLWRKEKGPPWIARMGLTHMMLVNEYNRLYRLGYVLVRLSGYDIGGKTHYAVIFEKRAKPYTAGRFGLNYTAFGFENARYAKMGYQLVRLSGYSVGRAVYYAGIWERAQGEPRRVFFDLTSKGHQERFNQLIPQGYRLVNINGYTVGVSARFASIWVQSPGRPWVARHGLSSSMYPKVSLNYFRRGYNLKQISGYVENARFRYAAIWER